jgi:hypothetical protein
MAWGPYDGEVTAIVPLAIGFDGRIDNVGLDSYNKHVFDFMKFYSCLRLPLGIL